MLNPVTLAQRPDKNKILVTMHPCTGTNPTPRFRVARYTDLARFASGRSREYRYTPFDTLEAAETFRKAHNTKHGIGKDKG